MYKREGRKKWKKILVWQLFGKRKKAKAKRARYEQLQHKNKKKERNVRGSKFVRGSTEERRGKISKERLQKQAS